MSTQSEKARRLHDLHAGNDPLVLFNIWDPGSARTVAQTGALAIATGSWSVAMAHGFSDGEAIPLDLALDNLARIIGACELPVSVDLERGYDNVAETIRRAIAAGAVGCNLEDGLAEGLRPIPEQAQRLAQARAAAHASGIPIFINARSDSFLKAAPEQHSVLMVEHTLERAKAYADAGANGLFAPGLSDESLIGLLVRGSPLPVNIMVGPATPSLSRLATLGVRRVSHGPGPYVLAMQALAKAAQQSATRD